MGYFGSPAKWSTVICQCSTGEPLRVGLAAASTADSGADHCGADSGANSRTSAAGSCELRAPGSSRTRFALRQAARQAGIGRHCHRSARPCTTMQLIRSHQARGTTLPEESIWQAEGGESSTVQVWQTGEKRLACPVSKRPTRHRPGLGHMDSTTGVLDWTARHPAPRARRLFFTSRLDSPRSLRRDRYGWIPGLLGWRTLAIQLHDDRIDQKGPTLASHRAGPLQG